MILYLLTIRSVFSLSKRDITSLWMIAGPLGCRVAASPCRYDNVNKLNDTDRRVDGLPGRRVGRLPCYSIKC